MSDLLTKHRDPIAFSILMPVFNPGRYIAQAIDSVVPQMAIQDELVIQDGGSTDDWQQHVPDRYLRDKRVKIVNEPDSGQSDALNRALERARNPIIGWLNADDLYAPETLGCVRATWSDAPELDMIYGSFDLIRGNRVIRTHVPGPFTESKLWRCGCYLYTGATFFRRDLLLASGGFPGDLDYAMDYELYWRIAKQDPEVHEMRMVLGIFRWHEASKSGHSQNSFVSEMARIRSARADSLPRKLSAPVLTLQHVLVWKSTGIRHSRIYSRLRGRRTF